MIFFFSLGCVVLSLNKNSKMSKDAAFLFKKCLDIEPVKDMSSHLKYFIRFKKILRCIWKCLFIKMCIFMLKLI